MTTTYDAITGRAAAFQDAVRKHARYSLARRWEDLNRRDLFLTTALAVRDSLIDGMIETESRYQQADAKRLYYLSMEFLMGRALGNNLYSLGLFEACKEGLAEMGVDLEEVREREPDAALGNGGLGRLAACFLDSLATLGMPGFGYGITMSTGCSNRKSTPGIRRNAPMRGELWARRG